MKISEILKESPDKSLNKDSVRIEIVDYDTSSASVDVDLGNDAVVFLNIEYETNASETDAGFGYEYGSINGYHHDTDIDGAVEVTDVAINDQMYSRRSKEDRYYAKRVAQQLRIPGRDSLNPQAIFKYLERSLGGSKQLYSAIEDAVNEQIGEELIQRELDAQRDRADDHRIDAYNDRYDSY